MMKAGLTLALLCGFATGAMADGTCKSMASDKKLAGAAMASFMKKCTNDATATCNTTAAGKKLSGAAKTSFTKKCVNDATGA